LVFGVEIVTGMAGFSLTILVKDYLILDINILSAMTIIFFLLNGWGFLAWNMV